MIVWFYYSVFYCKLKNKSDCVKMFGEVIRKQYIFGKAILKYTLMIKIWSMRAKTNSKNRSAVFQLLHIYSCDDYKGTDLKSGFVS